MVPDHETRAVYLDMPVATGHVLHGSLGQVDLGSLEWIEPHPEGFEWIEAYLAWREWNP
jgi:hypothetical protein